MEIKDKTKDYFDKREEFERGIYEDTLEIDKISKEIYRISKAFDITGNAIMAETLFNIYSDLRDSAESIRNKNNQKSALENNKIKNDFGEMFSTILNHTLELK